jgi:hypothetical protein
MSTFSAAVLNFFLPRPRSGEKTLVGGLDYRAPVNPVPGLLEIEEVHLLFKGVASRTLLLHLLSQPVSLLTRISRNALIHAPLHLHISAAP